MLTQIYEVGTPEEAAAISALAVDHIGIKVGDGSYQRELPPETVARIAAAIRPPSLFTLLFLGHDFDFIVATTLELKPAIVHLGAPSAKLQPDDLVALKRQLPDVKTMRSIPVADDRAIALSRSYDGVADFLLLDSIRASDGRVGALGVTHDWSISRRIVEAVRIPVILAGGLGPDNVAEAIRAVHPFGVDSKTKTDRDGSHVKDIARVRRFHEAAMAAI